MAARSLVSRIIRVSRRSPGEVDVKSSRMSILPNSDVSELADAIKFLVHFKWPPSLSLLSSCQTVCSLLDQTPDKLQGKPLTAETCDPISQVKWRHEDKAGEGGVSKDVAEWKKWRSDQRSRWRESGLAPKELLRLVQTMTEGGIIPNRDDYSRLLIVCLCLCDRKGTTEAGLHLAVREMVRRMKNDIGTTAASSVVMSSILPVASSQQQAERMWGNLVGVTGGPSKESSLHLLEAYLSVNDDPKAAVTTLMTQLAPNSVPVSSHTLERVLMSCIRSYKLSLAIGTYNCMTRRYGIAPSKRVYSQFTTLLSATSDSSAMSESLCYRILADTRVVFGGSPPVWVYSQMSKPMFKLRGLSGYTDMHRLSLEAATEYNRLYGSEVTALMRGAWEPSLYHSLIRCSSHFLEQGTTMALHLYREMAAQGIAVTERTFELLLGLAHKKEHLNSYVTPLLFEITKSLSKDHFVYLKEPLLQALARIYDYHTVGLRHNRKKGWYSLIKQDTPDFISLAVQLLVCAETPLVADSHQHCLDRLASLTREHSVSRCDLNSKASWKLAHIAEHQYQPLFRAL